MENVWYIPLIPLGSNKRGRKLDLSCGASDKCITPSVTSDSNLQEKMEPPLSLHPDLDMHHKQISHCQHSFSDVGANLNPSLPMELGSCSALDENLLDTSTSTSPSTSKSHFISFASYKNTHSRLKLSAQDYDDLLYGKNLGYFHPRSMSFMRVRTFTPKTIQTGTPQNFPTPAEVPLSPPTLQERVPFSAFTSNVDRIAQEEIVLEIAKKQRVTLKSTKVSAASAAPFQFVAVGETRKRDCKRKEGYFLHHIRGVHTIIQLRKRSFVSFDFSFSFCRFTQKEAVTGVAKRKDASLSILIRTFILQRRNIDVPFRIYDLVPLV